MTTPEYPVLLPSNTLHLRAFDKPDSKATKCGLPTKGAWAADPVPGRHTERLCKRCFS